MEFKYTPKSTSKGIKCKTLKHTDPIEREMHYAFMRHKAQANFRHEEYDLTFEDWQTLWPVHLFEQRGRLKDSLVLCRVDQTAEWSLSNCIVTTRKEWLNEYRDQPDGFGR